MSDNKERLEALNPTQSFIVQAPAGSGKTELLTQRFLKLLSSVKAPEEIIAVTFTRKAAAQMRQRILHALKNASQQTQAPDKEHEKMTWSLASQVLRKDEQMQWDLQQNPNRLRIVTIDALCTYIVNKAPILSNFGGMPEMLDFAEPYYQQAVERLLRETTVNESWASALAQLLLHLDNRISVISQLLVTMLKNRDQWLPYLVSIKNQEIDLKVYLDDCFQRMITSHLESLHQKFTCYLQHQLLPILRYAANALSESGEVNFLEAYSDVTSMPSPLVEHSEFWKDIAFWLTTQKNEWRKSFNQKTGFLSPSQTKDPKEKEIRKSRKKEMESLIEDLSKDDVLLTLLNETKMLPPTELNADQHQILNALAQLLPVLVGFLNIIFQETGKVDFIEVMLRALNALGDDLSPSDIALRLDHQLSHILIDEYQDTSVSQYKLFEKLVAGWEPNDGRTVFLVGDPMQSIYRFRGAKVSLFTQTKLQGLGHVKLRPLNLRVNFRSNENIILWINNTFSKIFPAQDDQSLEGVSYAKACAFQDKVKEETIHCHPILGDKKHQAQKISEIVLNALAKPATSIAVLVRAKRHLTDIIKQFKMLNIPFIAHEVEHLALRSHVIDLLSLLKATMDWTDNVACYAFLRAPWIGLTLADILVLSKNSETGIIWQSINNFENVHELSVDAKIRLRQKVPILSHWLKARQRQALHHWLRGLWIALGGPHCYSEPHFLKDIDTIFGLIKSYENGGKLLNIDELELKISQVYGDVSFEDPNSSDTGAKNIVELMTIHKAKGLEFDIVIMPHLEARTLNYEQALLLWYERSHPQGMDLILAPRRAQHEKVDPLYQYVTSQIRKKDDYEMERLLYVGATRAKQQLHLLYQSELVDGELKVPYSGSFMHKLWPHIQEKLTPPVVCESLLKDNNLIDTLPLHYSRLSQDWQLPKEIQCFIQQNLDKPEPTDLNIPPKIDEIARCAGIVFHRMLQRWVNEGGLIYPQQMILPHGVEKACLAALKQQGLYGNALLQAKEYVMQALMNMLSDPKGQWILDPKHTQKQTEWQLSISTSKGIENNIIDYAFVDNEGIRWIVDYKLTQTNNIDEKLLQQEIALYQSQLQRYRRILTQLEKRSVRCGLYFPHAKLWWEMTT